ncbi:MAG: GIY-YIG nuclease family protein [Acidobacteriaceae bacterium]
MRRDSAWVYIMTNRSRTLYVGVTSNLERRIQEHKSGFVEGSFTHRYRLDRLVYYEQFSMITSAIDREKQIKGWLRIKKIALIVSKNPEWKDLSEEWGKNFLHKE